LTLKLAVIVGEPSGKVKQRRTSNAIGSGKVFSQGFDQDWLLGVHPVSPPVIVL